MKLLIILIFTFRACFVLSSSDEDTSEKDQILCQFAGESFTSDYQFNKDDVLERCDIVVYGYYLVDYDVAVDTHVFESDKNALRSLKEAGKTVYILLSFVYKDLWDIFFRMEDQNIIDSMITPLKNFLTEFKIDGIIFESIDIYAFEGLDCLMSSFITNIKQEFCNLKCGLIVNGQSYENFCRTDVFDFSITNDKIDLYIIDLSPANNCDANTKLSGLVPIKKCDSNNLTTIEDMSTAVYLSNMDTCKIYARLATGVITPTQNESSIPLTSYSEYCINKEESCNWCADNSQVLYEKGNYVKNFPYTGLMLTFMETDDYYCNCECGKFPASNIIIDGWECKTLTPCAIIDGS